MLITDKNYDRGKAWSPAKRSEIKEPSSEFHISRLKSGRVMLINHYGFNGRSDMTVMLSNDDGATWPHKLLLDDRSDIAYSDAAEHNGYIYIAYARERGDEGRSIDEVYADSREILMAKVTEADIIAGKLTDPGSYLKQTVSKPNEYRGDESNHFYEIERCENSDPAARMLASEFNKEDIFPKIFDTCSFKKNAPIIDRIKAVIEDGLIHDISINEVSERVGISRYYMTHLFKQCTGTAVVDYKNELKLTKAKKMLISSDATISEIAYACGFASSSYFSDKFRRSEGISPNKYRVLHRNDSQ